MDAGDVLSQTHPDCEVAATSYTAKSLSVNGTISYLASDLLGSAEVALNNTIAAITFVV